MGTLDETGKTVKVVSEIVKTVKELIPQSESEKKTRSGPLQVVGRLVLGLVAILALCASASGYMDWHAKTKMTAETLYLRESIVYMAWIILLFCILGIAVLIWKNPLYLSSPSEIDPTIHGKLKEMSKGDTANQASGPDTKQTPDQSVPEENSESAQKKTK